MCEIADLTYNVVAFSEIMGMLWRRLNDHGKNWRHVYKALTLAEYLVKTGSERVAQQCRENIYAVQTLRDFQYVDRDGKDQGLNVREKAKQLVALLKDDEKLKEERAHALKTKEKLAQVSTVASAPASAPASSSLHSPPEIEQAWPQSTGEEELQLQLALAMSKEEAQQRSPPVPGEDLQMQLALSLSKEEHDKEERLRRGDDLRLQMAIEESQKQNVLLPDSGEPSLMDLADVFAASAPVASNDPWGAVPCEPAAAAAAAALPGHHPPALPAAAADPWGAATPTTVTTPVAPDPWGSAAPQPLLAAQPDSEGWAPQHGGSVAAGISDTWDILGSQPAMTVPLESWAPLPPPGPQPVTSVDPWAPVPRPECLDTSPPTAKPTFDPFAPPLTSANDDFSDFDALRAPVAESGADEPDLLAGEVPILRNEGGQSSDLFDLSPIGGSLPETPGSRPTPPARKTPESFLGPNAALVDLDALVSKSVKTSNPFLST
ncbi:epsin-1-like, partial [Cetorhinus maximus]